MKYIKQIAIISTLIICFFKVENVLAQKVDYIVYYSEKQNFKIVSGKSSLLKKGDFIDKNNLLDVSSKLVLICPNFNSITLQKGKYLASKLIANCKQNKDSFTANYFKFVWDGFTHPHASVEAEPEKYMRNSGAVTRSKNAGLAISIDTIRYFSGPLSISLKKKTDTATLLLFKIKNKALSTSKSVGYINFAGADNFTPGAYNWSTKDSKGKSSKLNVLIKLDKDEYLKQINLITQNIIAYNIAETYFMKGFVLEQYGFLAEAFKNYSIAYNLDKRNKIYTSFYNRFYVN
jgi:hypothetical protein